MSVLRISLAGFLLTASFPAAGCSGESSGRQSAKSGAPAAQDLSVQSTDALVMITNSTSGAKRERYGELDKAEQRYRAVIALMPDKPKGYWLLSKMLAEKRPEAHDEAVKLARQALALPKLTDLDRNAVQKVLDQLEGSTQAR